MSEASDDPDVKAALAAEPVFRAIAEACGGQIEIPVLLRVNALMTALLLRHTPCEGEQITLAIEAVLREQDALDGIVQGLVLLGMVPASALYTDSEGAN